jgi:hypothetical protein
MKVKKEDYENIYDCIVTGQVPPDVINDYFQDKNFYRYYILRTKQSAEDEEYLKELKEKL